MGDELIGHVLETLERAGLRAEAAYPAGRWVQATEPLAAVELHDLDFSGGQAKLTVWVLSPGTLGGLACQNAAAAAAAALYGAGMDVHMSRMEFQSRNDCFCIGLEVALAAHFDEAWSIGDRWSITCGDTLLEGVESFRAVRDQGRRVVGAFCQSAPVAVTPGNGGWTLTLVQWVRGTEDSQTEPFALVLADGSKTITYTGCHWNREEWEHLQGGLRRTRTGFALGREVSRDE